MAWSIQAGVAGRLIPGDSLVMSQGCHSWDAQAAPQPGRCGTRLPGGGARRLAEMRSSRPGADCLTPPLHEVPEKHADPRYTVSDLLWGDIWLTCSRALQANRPGWHCEPRSPFQHDTQQSRDGGQAAESWRSATPVDKRARERDKEKKLPPSKRKAKGKLVEGLDCQVFFGQYLFSYFRLPSLSPGTRVRPR